MRYVLIGIAFFVLGVGTFIGLNQANPQTFSIFQQKVTKPFQPEVTLRGNMKPFYGTIVGKTDTEIEVKNRDGNTSKIQIADGTTFTGGRKTDLKTSMIVSGVGQMNNKSLIAKNIQINPKTIR